MPRCMLKKSRSGMFSELKQKQRHNHQNIQASPRGILSKYQTTTKTGGPQQPRTFWNLRGASSMVKKNPDTSRPTASDARGEGREGGNCL